MIKTEIFCFICEFLCNNEDSKEIIEAKRRFITKAHLLSKDFEVLYISEFKHPLDDAGHNFDRLLPSLTGRTIITAQDRKVYEDFTTFAFSVILKIPEPTPQVLDQVAEQLNITDGHAEVKLPSMVNPIPLSTTGSLYPDAQPYAG